MSVATTKDPAPDMRAEPSMPYARWAFLLTILIAELLALTLRFDTESLRHESGWWAELLGLADLVPRLVISIAVAIWVFARQAIANGVAAAVGAAGGSRALASILPHSSGRFCWICLHYGVGDGRRGSGFGTPGGVGCRLDGAGFGRGDFLVRRRGGTGIVADPAPAPPPVWLPSARSLEESVGRPADGPASFGEAFTRQPSGWSEAC